ncbi:MAG: type II toxin-antitoxin system Phd/YefM family antitoxin [Candidatus Dormibacteria bacterium]
MAGDEVGIRELKTHASALVRRVAAGATIDITDRGRPVARLVPVQDDDRWWDRMVERGALIPATRDLAQLLAESPPPPAASGQPSLFDALMEQRADER